MICANTCLKDSNLYNASNVTLSTMSSVTKFLDSHQIKYVLHEHPAVYTCEEAEKYCGDIPGLPCKNLLLKNKGSKRFFLVVLPAKKRTELKKFGEIVSEKKVSFANAEALLDKLGLTAGAVSPFGLLNDKNNEVEVYVDKDVYDADTVSFHPNRNTASLELSGAMFKKFLQVIDQEVHVVEL
jgi:Ala-tRNA(Pro) deacylase